MAGLEMNDNATFFLIDDLHQASTFPRSSNQKSPLLGSVAEDGNSRCTHISKQFFSPEAETLEQRNA